MKLLVTICVSFLTFFTMYHFQVGTIFTWIILIALWTVIDYSAYKNPFSWKEYTLLVVIFSIIEIVTGTTYFNFF